MGSMRGAGAQADLDCQSQLSTVGCTDRPRSEEKVGFLPKAKLKPTAILSCCEQSDLDIETRFCSRAVERSAAQLQIQRLDCKSEAKLMQLRAQLSAAELNCQLQTNALQLKPQLQRGPFNCRLQLRSRLNCQLYTSTAKPAASL